MNDGSGYLLYHSIGQYPGKARDLRAAMADFATVWGEADDGQWPVILGLRARYLARWAALIGAPEASVTTAENVTAAFASLMTALPRDVLSGRKLLVAGDCFPSLHFLLTGMQERLGFTLETVPLRQGASWVEDEDLAAAWTAEVGFALLTWVSSTSSHRSDIASLAAHGRTMGSLIAVDITQAAGLLPFDVNAPVVDAAMSTSLKWMCGTPGAGMLYVAPELINRSQPELRGWFSQPDPFNWDLDRFSYAPDIRRFDHGTPGIVAAAATLPAMDWHAAQDHAAILAHNRLLSERLIDGVDELGLPLVSPREAETRGGSVMLRLPTAIPSNEVLAGLRAADCWADARGQLLRLSPGVMTTAEGIDRALDAIASVRGSG